MFKFNLDIVMNEKRSKVEERGGERGSRRSGITNSRSMKGRNNK